MLLLHLRCVGAPLTVTGVEDVFCASLCLDPENTIDGDTSTKWYDGDFAANGGSTLRLTLPAAAQVVTYEFTTANDRPQRDPTSWTFGILRADGGYEVLGSVSDFVPPEGREAAFGAAGIACRGISDASTVS